MAVGCPSGAPRASISSINILYHVWVQGMLIGIRRFKGHAWLGKPRAQRVGKTSVAFFREFVSYQCHSTLIAGPPSRKPPHL